MEGTGEAQIKRTRQRASEFGADIPIEHVLHETVYSLEALMKIEADSQKLNVTVASLKMALELILNCTVTRNFSPVHKLSRMLATTIKWINEKEKSRAGAKGAASISALEAVENNVKCNFTKSENTVRKEIKIEISSENDSSFDGGSEFTDEEESFDPEKVRGSKKRVRKFECDLCGKFLGNPQSLKRHKLTHQAELPFKCDNCDKAYASQHGLIAHMKIHTEDETVRKPHKCDQCEWRFTSLSHLEEHKQTHLPIEERRKFKCVTCNKRFVSEKILAGHMKNHLDAETKYKCQICEKSYRYSSNLKSHMNTHEEDDELKRPHKCDICGDRFTCAANLRTHARRKHILKDDPTFEKAECDICGKILSKHYALTAHRETHMADDDPRKTTFECGICGKILSTKSSLTAHQKRHLDEDDPKLVDLKRQHTCNQCGYATLTAGALKQHMIRHTGNKPFQCELCPKSFILEITLSKHLESHEKGTVHKPHRRTKFCNLCPKRFVKKLDLHTHLKRHQEGIAGSSSDAEGEDLERIFSCPKCPQKFRSEWKFKQHQLLHNGRNKNKCGVCGLTFSRKEHLQKHTRRKHPETVKNDETKVRRGPVPTKRARCADSEAEEESDDDDVEKYSNSDDARASTSKGAASESGFADSLQKKPDLSSTNIARKSISSFFTAKQ